jgi:uncharacterized membrane protein
LTKETISSKFEKFSHKIFDYWENHALIVNFLFALIPISMYYFGFLNNIRENTGSIITFAAGLITLNGVFLTLLVTLKGSPIFIRLKSLFPKLHDYLYYGLKKQIISCIYLILINLIISIVGEVDNFILVVTGIVLWSYFMVDVSIGALYNLKIVTDLAIKDVDLPKKMT